MFRCRRLHRKLDLAPTHRRRRRYRSSIPTGRTRTDGRDSRRRTRTSALDPRRHPRERPPAGAARTPSRVESSDEFAARRRPRRRADSLAGYANPAASCSPADRLALNRKALFWRRVGTDCGVVVNGTHRKRRSAAPAPHHFRSQELLVIGIRCVCLEVPSKFCNALVQLSKYDVAAVAAENLRLRESQKRRRIRRGIPARTHPASAEPRVDSSRGCRCLRSPDG